MSTQRNILKPLRKWKNKSNRKPLILRGARQVGKTTVVNEFAKDFDLFISLNLEKEAHKKPFLESENTVQLVDALFFMNNIEKNTKNVFIFIDEIQEVPKAINWLRYFYEEYPNLYVISAGSLLETILDNKVKFPVGRVEFLVLRPFSFDEFLLALNETEVLKAYNMIPFPEYAYDKTLKLFNLYTLIGGMPEIVTHYAENRDITALGEVFSSLLASYIDDVEKYARNNTLVQVIRICIQVAFKEAGQRIKFANFGNTNYKSREIGEALRTLEKTFILDLVYPQTSYGLPLLSNYKKSPRLQVFDTGLLNYFGGLQSELFQIKDLQDAQKGKIAEHIVGQELLAKDYSPLSKLNFWVRDKNNANAEIDFIIAYKGNIIPIEVKSGATGTLKSLHYYMNNSKSPIAIRLYAGKIKKQTIVVKNKKPYELLNLPYFLTAKIDEYLAFYDA